MASIHGDIQFFTSDLRGKSFPIGSPERYLQHDQLEESDRPTCLLYKSGVICVFPKFYYKSDPSFGTKFDFPIWFAAVLTVAFAAVPWIPWSNQFSLRTVLIVTTLVAVLVGLLVYAARR